VVSFFFLKQLKYTLLVELIQLEQLFRNNTGGTFNVTGFSTGTTDTSVTGTYTAGTAVFRNNTGGTFNVTGFNTNDTCYWWNIQMEQQHLETILVEHLMIDLVR
jgi:hypothetical protein